MTAENGSSEITAPVEPNIVGVKQKGIRLDDPDNFTLIGLDTDDGKKHPLYDERVDIPADPSLVKNIIELGVFQPILVRENGDRKEVIAGRQRVKAARLANVELRKRGERPIMVPYIVKRGTEESVHMGMMLSENMLRRDDDVVTKAAKAARFMQLEDNIETCATYFGVTPQTVDYWLKFKDLHPEVHEVVRQGKMAPTAAVKLAKLTKEEQFEQVQKLLAKGTTTNAEVEHVLKKTKKAKKAGKKDEEVEVNMPITQRQLKKLLKYWEEDGGADDVEPATIQFARAIVGEISPKRVKGLAKSMARAGLVEEEDEE